MAELKTRKTGASVNEFLNSIDDQQRRKDSLKRIKSGRIDYSK